MKEFINYISQFSHLSQEQLDLISNKDGKFQLQKDEDLSKLNIHE